MDANGRLSPWRMTEAHVVEASVAHDIAEIIHRLSRDNKNCARIREIDDLLRMETPFERHKRWAYVRRPYDTLPSYPGESGRVPTIAGVQSEMGYACGAYRRISPGRCSLLQLPRVLVSTVIRPLWLAAEQRVIIDRLAARYEPYNKKLGDRIRALSIC